MTVVSVAVCCSVLHIPRLLPANSGSGLTCLSLTIQVRTGSQMQRLKAAIEMTSW